MISIITLAIPKLLMIASNIPVRINGIVFGKFKFSANLPAKIPVVNAIAKETIATYDSAIINYNIKLLFKLINSIFCY